MRWEAAKALQRLHNPAVVTDLLKTLRNDEEYTRCARGFGRALGSIPRTASSRGWWERLNARELAINTTAELR